jgi:hypothetical protein
MSTLAHNGLISKKSGKRTVAAALPYAGALRMKEGEMVVVLNRLRLLDGVPEVLAATKRLDWTSSRRICCRRGRAAPPCS